MDKVSIVIPVFNEEESLKPLHEALRNDVDTLSYNFEFLYIDDGSTDRSFEILKDVHRQDPRVKVIRFRKNFGQTQALSAGFDHVTGDLVITMDADLQNDPADIEKMLAKAQEGYDIVSGWRIKRQDPFLSRLLPSLIANWIISFTTGVKLHDYGCTLKVYRKEIIKDIHIYGELHRFLPAIASLQGAKIAEIPVQHHARQFGKSKYNFSRSIKVILDLITVRFMMLYSTKPMQIFGLMGIISGLAGFFIAAYLSIQWFMGVGLAERPLLLLAIVLIIVGAQFVSMGLLGEMMVRIYHETQNKPTYSIKEIIE